MKEPQQIPHYSNYGPGLCLYYIKSGVPNSVLREVFTTIAVRIILITDGTFKIDIANGQYTLHRQDILTIPATIHCSASTIGNRYSLYLLTASTPFLVEHSLNSFGKESFNFLVTQSPIVIQPNLQAYNTIAGLFKHLGLILTNTDDSAFQKEKVTLCFNLLLFELVELYTRKSSNVIKRGSQREKLVLGFLTLVAQHCRGQHGVKFYSDRLFITPDYMNKVVREITGSTVKYFIEQAIIAEAKNLLSTTEYTVREISEALDFSHPGSFSTFFKKLAGISPSAYRRTKPNGTTQEGGTYGAFFVLWDKKSGQ